MHHQHLTTDLALFELERQRLIREMGRPRRRPSTARRTARVRDSLTQMFRRDA